MRTEDGKVVVAIKTDWEFSPRPVHKSSIENILSNRAINLYGLLVDEMNGHIIKDFNDYYDENYPNGFDSDADLEIYDYGLSGKAMEAAKKLRFEDMVIVSVDLHTATYTFFDEKYRTLVTMKLGKMYLSE